MAEIPDNLKEIIDNALQEVLGELKFPPFKKEEEKKDEEHKETHDDDVSEAVKDFLETKGNHLETKEEKEAKEKSYAGLEEATKAWLENNNNNTFKGKEL